ncbi:PBECR2 nuclease fold domain-containing protein [Nanoarchaeota archaeon]
MNIVFETIDKSGRKIRLTQKQWEHITITHHKLSNYLSEIKQTIENPIKITYQESGGLRKYFNYLKHRNHSDKYLRVIVKYLNGEGFVLTAHFMRNIR